MTDELMANMYYVKASEAYDNDNFSEAISFCNTAISKGIQDARIYNNRAYCYIAQGECLKARLDLESSLKLDSTDSWVRDTINELKSKGF